MKTTQYLSIILLITAVTFFSSCNSDEIITNGSGNSSTVIGTLIDSRGEPVYPMKVWLNYEPAFVNQNGSFIFDSVSFPYHLMLNKPGDSAYFYYSGMINKKPVISLPDFYYMDQVKTATIFLSVPRPLNNGRNLVKFISKDNISIYSSFFQSDSNGVIEISWKGEQNKITGKIIVLQGQVNENQSMISYDKFGSKDTAVKAGETVFIRLNSADLQYNPIESNVSLNMPSGVTGVNIEAQIAFDGYNKNNNLVFYTLWGSQPVIPVPLNLLLPYKINLIVSFSNWKHLQRHCNILLAPGGTANIIDKDFTLLYPAHDTSGVDYNTKFVNNGSSGLYLTHVSLDYYPQHFFLHIYSASNNFSLPYFPMYNLNFTSGTRFNWYSVNYDGYTNIDEFISQNRMDNKPFYSANSESRRFTLK
ncbi:MAG: hypothetical protein EHM58_14210 [Ignavibacteriae bacterium]|nr:MAG: hypothetical protein EHM58_14210 [Ignavibacteriota bacterium]